MTIKTDSWHYKWYAYWLTYGRGNKIEFRENLCHYVRVLLFWAPMTWIDRHTAWDWGVWTPRFVLGVIALIYVGLFGLLLVMSAITQTTKFLMGIGSFGGLVSCIGLLVLLVKTMRGKRLEIPGTIKLAGGYVVARKRRICPFIEFDEQEARA